VDEKLILFYLWVVENTPLFMVKKEAFEWIIMDRKLLN